MGFDTGFSPAEGEAKGEARGEAAALRAAILEVFAARGLTVDPDVQAMIGGCRDLSLLKHWHRQAITATASTESFRDNDSPPSAAMRRHAGWACPAAPGSTPTSR